jgi:hypothetical protein
MSDTVIVYPAQKLTIKSMRGSDFKLVINVKDSDGSNYDFTTINTGAGDTTPTTHQAFIRIRRADGGPVQNSPGGVELGVIDPNTGLIAPGIGLENTLNAGFGLTGGDVEDGKITFEWDQSFGNDYAPWPGRYKYHIHTRAWNNGPETIWLHGDFIVVDNNPWSSSPITPGTAGDNTVG